MAVTVEKIKERVRVLWPNANLSTKRLDALAAGLATKPADGADDDAIDAVLEQANGFISFEDIAKDDDRMRTLEANQKPNPTPTPTPTPNPNPAPTPTADTPQWALDLAASNKKLLDEMAELKTGKLTDAKKSAAQVAFEKSEVLKKLDPKTREIWLNRIAVSAETTDEEITTQVTALETEYSEMQQSIANGLGYSGMPPTNGDAAKGSDDKVIDAVVSSFNI